MTTTTDPLLSLLAIENGYLSARWNFDDAVGTPVSSPGGVGNSASVSYSFLAEVPTYYASDGISITGFSQFTEAEKLATRDVLASVSAVANISFVEGAPGTGDISFGKNAQPEWLGLRHIDS